MLFIYMCVDYNVKYTFFVHIGIYVELHPEAIFCLSFTLLL